LDELACNPLAAGLRFKGSSGQICEWQIVGIDNQWKGNFNHFRLPFLPHCAIFAPLSRQFRHGTMIDW
jgi:hypothetical protein